MTSSKKKHLFPFRLVLFLCSFLLAILLGACSISLPGLLKTGPKFVRATYFYHNYHDESGCNTLIDSNGVILSQKKDLIDVANSIDNSKIVTLSAAGPGGSGGTLELAGESGSSVIAENVYDFKLSTNGNAILYLSDFDGKSGVLYHCDLKSMEKTKLTENAFGYNAKNDQWDHTYFVSLLSISPDGKTVGYLEGKSDSFPSGAIRTIGKEPRILNKGLFPLFLTNGGKTVYCLKTEDRNATASSLCALSGDGLATLCEAVEPTATTLIQASADHEELFLTAGDNMIYCRCGEIVKKYPNNNYFIIAPNVLTNYVSYGLRLFDYNFTVYDRDLNGGMAGLFFTAASNNERVVCYLNENAEMEEIRSPEPFYSLSLSLDGKKLLLWGESQTLYLVDAASKELSPTRLAQNVKSFCSDADFENVYYLDLDGQLWKINCKDKKPESLAANLDALFIVFQDKTKTIFASADPDGDRVYSVYSIKESENNVDLIKMNHSDFPLMLSVTADSVSYLANADLEKQTGDLYFIVGEEPPVKIKRVSY